MCCAINRCSTGPLHNHLRDTLAAERLAADKGLALDGGEQIADGGKGEEDARSDQTRVGPNGAEELQDGHDAVGGGAKIVGRDGADGGIELARGRANAEQQRDLDEQNQEGGCSVVA